jgi:tetratricopeptide (TPR) repeat protein
MRGHFMEITAESVKKSITQRKVLPVTKITSEQANELSDHPENKPNTASFEQRLAEAINLHNEGVAGNTGSVWEASRVLEELRVDHPDRPIADAFLGSVMSLIARDETNPLTRFQWVQRGLKLLDDAVASDPSDSRIRMLRGNVAYRLPEQFFQRTETAIEDYLVLIEGELRNPGSISIETYNKLIYELGEAYHRINRVQEAELCWSKLLKQTNDPKYRRLIEQKMKLGNGEAESDS